MAYSLDFQLKSEFLRVEISGDRTEGDLVTGARAAWTKVAATCRENNLSRILLVSSATGTYNTADGYDINSTLEECGVEKTWKIAFVNLDADSYHDIQFGETVAVNRGYWLRLFSTENDAMAWLLDRT